MNKSKKLTLLILACTFCLSLIGCNSTNTKNTQEKSELTISAAASLKEAMADIENEFNSENPNIKLTFNFGSSGSLQKQIEQGAPCDLFISAGESQMDSLENAGLLLDDTKKDLVKNALVLIINENTTVNSIEDLTSDKINHIAMGEPASVPAGKYAKEVLTNLNLFDVLQPKLVYAKDVKEVLSWVASNNADAGFVYKSDTYGVDSIKIVETIPEEYHSPINYPVAIVKDSKNQDTAKLFEDFLFSDKAKQIFEKYGYIAL
ncbi:molybdate ABC transporter substrate-binding protein [Clostridium sp. SM-530-WT-3G]|uniref:molybdate ABC transporter substrate-binding protein n=1 Tax=Clostridium sp. SM-530-WT-3G TaxID=2725303 RepID=UPI00145D4F60|nr:molybdate ABC transporter substrate-binding protein [Clostridium sp. SM-530-WT-3G]